MKPSTMKESTPMGEHYILLQNIRTRDNSYGVKLCLHKTLYSP